MEGHVEGVACVVYSLASCLHIWKSTHRVCTPHVVSAVKSLPSIRASI